MDEHFSLLSIDDKLLSLVQFAGCKWAAIVCDNRIYAYPDEVRGLAGETDGLTHFVDNTARIKTTPIRGGKLVLSGLPEDFDERTLQFIVEDLEEEIELASIFDTLCKAGLTISSNLSLNPLLHRLMGLCEEIFDNEVSAVMLLDAAKQELYWEVSRGEGSAHFGKKMTLPVGKGIGGHVAQTGEAVLANDVSKDPRWCPSYDLKTGFQTKSLMCVPIQFYGNVLGVIEIINKRNGRFTPRDLKVLQVLGVQAGAAIENALIYKALKDSHKKLVGTLESITDGFLSLDREWRCTYFNETGAMMVGMKRDDLIGKMLWELFPHAVNTRFYTEFHRAVAKNNPIHFEEFYPEPLNRWIECHGYPSPEGLSVYFRDITERRRMEDELRISRDVLELRVRERTAELEHKNRELQEFAFIASHDLTEPLRKIQSFGDLLKAKSDRLGEQERDYISRMTGAANRMQELLDALLRYSRVETHGRDFLPLKLEDIVQTVTADLEVSIRKLGARVESGFLPIINGDPYQWRQLFQNLIANGIKYHRSEVKTVIKVVGEENNGIARIMVADNGIGFDEKYLDKIFQPFQRLHGRHEYPGTGIGLAICKKIVERHGGTITARSTPGKGSTFIITLPVDKTKAMHRPKSRVIQDISSPENL